MVVQGWVPMLLLLLLCACATQKTDWSARVGKYTYEQAVHDLGPPQRQMKLDGGAMVAEWQTQRGRTEVYYPANYAFGPYGQRYPGMYGGMPMTNTIPDRYLRLTFDASGRLTDWKEVTVPLATPIIVPR
jgi:hypothetical protein